MYLCRFGSTLRRPHSGDSGGSQTYCRVLRLRPPVSLLPQVDATGLSPVAGNGGGGPPPYLALEGMRRDLLACGGAAAVWAMATRRLAPGGSLGRRCGLFVGVPLAAA